MSSEGLSEAAVTRPGGWRNDYHIWWFSFGVEELRADYIDVIGLNHRLGLPVQLSSELQGCGQLLLLMMFLKRNKIMPRTIAGDKNWI